MSFVQELLTQAKTANAIPSNYRLARVMGVTDNTLNNWQSGRGMPGDVQAVRLAQMAGVNPAIVLAELAAERAKDDVTKAVWRGLAEHLRGAGLAVIVAAICSFGAPPEARAFEVTHSVDQAGLCVMSTKESAGAPPQADAKAMRRCSASYLALLDAALLGGDPAQGPILFSGPFVMDTHERLAQTRQDFASGKMGTLDGIPFKAESQS